MARRFRKLAHSQYECKYHIIFCPKYRYKILDEVVSKYVYQEIYRRCSQKDGIEILELNVQTDHVHLIVWIPPKYAVSNFVGYLKGKLALRLFDRFPGLRKRYWGQHVWSRGYCVSSVVLDEDHIRKYVKWQEKKVETSHHGQSHLF